VNGTTVPPVPVLDPGRISRLRDVFAGGHLALEADRRAAAGILERWPATADLVKGANAFHERAAAWAVSGGTPDSPVPPAAGVIFAACGYPLPGGFHAAARAARPDALYCYASADPVTVSYCRSLLAVCDPLRVSAYQASARDPAAVLGAFAAQVLLDRGPVMVQLQFCAQRWPSAFCAWAVAEYGRLLPSGSTLALSLGVPGGGNPSSAELVAGLSRAGASEFHAHDEAEVTAWITEAEPKLILAGIGDVRGRELEWATARFAALRPAARVIEAVALVP
jgi:hypothetical protein